MQTETFLTLPIEIQLKIISYLYYRDILCLQRVSRYCSNLARKDLRYEKILEVAHQLKKIIDQGRDYTVRETEHSKNIELNPSFFRHPFKHLLHHKLFRSHFTKECYKETRIKNLIPLVSSEATIIKALLLQYGRYIRLDEGLDLIARVESKPSHFRTEFITERFGALIKANELPTRYTSHSDLSEATLITLIKESEMRKGDTERTQRQVTLEARRRQSYR